MTLWTRHLWLSLLLVSSLVPTEAMAQPTIQDCAGAIPVCGALFTQPASFAGNGNVPAELHPNSCLRRNELNDVWYTLTVQAGGQLCFTLAPNNPADDYDWAVYDLTQAGCAQIANNLNLEVSCNYSGTRGATGPNGQPGNQNAPCLQVAAGDVYAVNISNYSSTQNGYTLDFSASTATIFDTVPPELAGVTVAPACGATSGGLRFSEPVLCNSVETGDFQLTGPGSPVTITGVTSGVCQSNGDQDMRFKVDFSPPLTDPGTYDLCLVGGSGFVEDLCGNTATSSCVSFSVPGPARAELDLKETYCPGEEIFGDGRNSIYDTRHFWSIQKSDRYWNRFGPEITQWFQGPAGVRNLTDFAAAKNLALECGHYYRVKLAVGGPCTGWNETTKLIYIQPCVEADAGPDRSICPGECVTLGSRDGWLQEICDRWRKDFAWEPPAGLGNPNAKRTSACPTTTTEYSLTVTSKSTGCKATDRVLVEVGASADAGPDRVLVDPITCTVGPGKAAQLGTPAVPGCTYRWSPTTYLDDPAAAQPTIEYAGGTIPPITYTLTISCPDVCQASDTVRVEFVQC